MAEQVKKPKINVREIIGIILIFLLIFAALQFTLQSFRVNGISMETSFHNGQYILVEKLRYHFSSPGRGQVIVFDNPRPPHERLIKRVIGLPEETVEIKKGHIYINGVMLEETPEFAAIPYADDFSVTIPPDHYWVIGDNRANSSGSHVFGPVPRENIVGRVWLCYWPPSQWGLSPHYSANIENVVTASTSVL